MQIILKKPLITEKTMKLAQGNEYTFMVGRNTTKEQIAKAVANKFNVSVLKVKTVNVKGESKMQRKVRKFFTTSGFKKAIVQIKKGQTIPVFETPKEEAVVTTAESKPVVMKERKGNLLSRTKVRVEKSSVGVVPTTQRKVIPT